MQAPKIVCNFSQMVDVYQDINGKSSEKDSTLPSVISNETPVWQEEEEPADKDNMEVEVDDESPVFGSQEEEIQFLKEKLKGNFFFFLYIFFILTIK